MEHANLFSHFNLSESEQKLFLTLYTHKTKTVGELSKLLGISRPTIYTQLEKLLKLDLIYESQHNGVKVFSCNCASYIENIFEKTILDLDAKKHGLSTFFESLENKNMLETTSATISIFKGKEQLEHVLREMLLQKNIETKSYWPIQTMLQTLSPDFFKYHNKERIFRKISVKAIWPESEISTIDTHSFLGFGSKFLREIRVAPNNTSFSSGYWIYGDTVAFLSNPQENFGFIVKSKAFAQTLSSQFDLIWETSKDISEIV
jgi:sugar-specific transcriptional regulator TrmB